MITHLTKHDDGWALVLDQSLLAQLQIDPRALLEITTDGQTLVVSPVKDVGRKEKFENAVKETNARYGKALKKLAE